MLSRFNHHVVRLHPRAVLILGGINDIKRIPLPQIERNLASMAETAEQHGIYVVLAALLPTGERDADKPSAAHIAGQDDSVSGHNRIMFGHDQIQTLNNWLKNFANQKHYTLVDYHFALAADRGYFQKGLTTDGVHPTAVAYQRMEALLRDAIQPAIRNSR
jgi:lysophospholipase L1-like esterase